MQAEKPQNRDSSVASDERPKGASALWGSIGFPLKRHRSPHGQVTAVSMMKDEGPYVIEWIAHHLAIGFTDLVVYTNDCSDGTDSMLIRLEELGLCQPPQRYSRGYSAAAFGPELCPGRACCAAV